MTARRVSNLLVHNFPENGVKFLLHHPGNLHDLFRMLARVHQTLPDPQGFDFAQRTIEPDTMIRSDFSHSVTDLLVRLPFRSAEPASVWIKVYVLFEHLSAHQRHIVPRSLGYAMDAYCLQERRWLEKHETLQGFQYEVVLPVVIYTGERTWQAPTAFRELVQGGDVFTEFIPETKPVFLSLPGQSEQELVQYGGTFGTVLHVLQQRSAAIAAFHRLFSKAAGTIEGQVARDRHRRVELLSYLLALMYHFRSKKEHDSLRAELERSIQDPSVRKEIHAVGQTIAESLREEGELKGRREGRIEGELEGTLKTKQQDLILLLRRKFGKKVTSAIVAQVERTMDLPTLDQWLTNFVDANTLEAVGIPLKR
jgi:hypothetical protein